MKKTVTVILLVLLTLALAAGGYLVWDYLSTHVRVADVYYPRALETLDLRGVGMSPEDYDRVQEKMPQCDITWNVPFQGGYYPSDTATLVVKSLSDGDVDRLDYLTGLQKVNAVGCRDYDQLLELQRRHPDCQVFYDVELGKERFNESAREVTITGLRQDDIPLLRYLPGLWRVHLVNPKADAEAVFALKEQYPNVRFSWEYRVRDLTITQQDTQADFSGMTVALSTVKRAVSYFPDVETVLMMDCGMDNETLAAFRKEMREQCKVVWTVDCGGIAVRTDATSFIPVKHNVYYFHDDDVYNLRYCEDMIAVDLGHMTFTELEWVEYMPNLKYLILAHTTVTDISSLATCKNLVFLELDWTGIRDYEPLLGCTALEDLNLGLTWGDYEVIGQMTWLKNLWWKGRGYKALNYLTEKLPDTRLMFNSALTVGSGWRKLQNYYDMRDALGMHYMEG